MQEEIDTSWMDSFEKTEMEYAKYYLDDVRSIKLTNVYINKDYNVETWQEEIFILKDKNKLQKEELLGILKKASFLRGKKHSLLSMFQYNVSLEPENVTAYLKRNDIENQFVSIIKNIDDIYWKKTISMFHELNQLMLVFVDVCHNEHSLSSKTLTKKIFISALQRKKTRRNIL